MTTQTAVQCRVLGPFELVVNGVPRHLGGPKIQGVLARLAISGGQTVSVGALVTELWGERAPADAYRTVRTYVSRLRQALERWGAAADEILLTRPPGYRLGIDPAQLDAARFERLVLAGRRALEAGAPDNAVEQLTAALALWRGDALAEFDDLPALRAEGLRLNQMRLAATEDRIDAALRVNRVTDVIDELEYLAALNPTRERLWGQLMTALYRMGRQVDALAAFRTARNVLINDHGVEPSPRLAEIHQRVLRHDLSLVMPDPMASGGRTHIPG